MTRNETLAYNRGVSSLASIAHAAAEVLRARINAAPTRYNFAIASLEGIVEATAELALPLPLPPDGSAPATMLLPRPIAPVSGAAAQSSETDRCKEVSHGC